MSELAFNVNGERFDLPEEASCWRVRRFKPSGRGTPEVVFGDSGLPLIIPIDTDIGEFRAAVRNAPGRYRLDAVDESHKSCEEATAAYVQLSGETATSAPAAVTVARSEGDELLREIVRANAEMVKTIAEKFATVMDSAAGLLRAADGAGMPSREPTVLPVQLAGAWRNAAAETAAPKQEVLEDDFEEEESSGTMEIVRMLGDVASEAMPLVKHHIHTKFLGLTPEQSMAMMGGPVPPAAAGSAGSETGSEVKGAETASVEVPTTAVAKTPTPDFFVHLAAIEQRLTPTESELARRAIKQMPPRAMATWKEQILRLTPDEAAALVRAECERLAAHEGEADSVEADEPQKEVA